MLRKKRLGVCSCLQRTIEDDDVAVARGTVFRRYRRELVSKPAISLKNTWGGYHITTLLPPRKAACHAADAIFYIVS